MVRRGFNIVFQDYALFPNLNVYQNITYGLKNKPGISSPQEVEELIDLLNLGEHLTKRIDQLSEGQKQRTALARTMIMKPRILLLDEPLSALDGVIKESIKDQIQQIAREFHLTTIIVTHDPEEALTLSGRVLIIDQGRISVCPPGTHHPCSGKRFCPDIYSETSGNQTPSRLRSVRQHVRRSATGGIRSFHVS